MNAFGQITQETLGNGVVTNRAYDKVTSWLTAATAGVGGGSGLLNQSYEEDENGNVTQRQDNNHGLTENLFYDADYRLTCATLTSGCSTPTFVYDAGDAGPGNITTQIGVGTYTYPAAGQTRPHAVTSINGTFNGINNPAFTYDANGNMTNRASSSANVTWSSYNYPTVVSATDATGTEEVQFNYGPDRERWEQIYTVSGTTEQTYYIGGLMDLVFSGGTTNYRHYIYAGSEPIAVYSRTAAGAITMSYMQEDHQGSVSAITSSAGTTSVDESFSAFGTRRNPATWTGPPTTSDLNTIESLSRQGYTFQTWLGQSMGLNHMHGRVQDAILGRFLSPDPHVPDPSNAQSYNRFSFTINNPLTRIDPSGFDDGDPHIQCEGGCPLGSGAVGAVASSGGTLDEITVTGTAPSADTASAPSADTANAAVGGLATGGSGNATGMGGSGGAAPAPSAAQAAQSLSSSATTGSPIPSDPNYPDNSMIPTLIPTFDAIGAGHAIEAITVITIGVGVALPLGVGIGVGILLIGGSYVVGEVIGTGLCLAFTNNCAGK
jgi:RHS repeat-associated protein